MTKQEAQEAMRAGKKVTHLYFTSDEWMTMEHGLILLEDGVRCSEHEFWHFRTENYWNEGYSIFTDKEQKQEKQEKQEHCQGMCRIKKTDCFSYDHANGKCLTIKHSCQHRTFRY